jgi:hypothetical protein
MQASHVPEFAIPGQAIQLLGVARETCREIGRDKDFKKILVIEQASYGVTIRTVRRDRSDQYNHACFDSQVCDFRNAPDVLAPVFPTEAQVAVQAFAQYVAIQHQTGQSALAKSFTKFVRERGFPCTR